MKKTHIFVLLNILFAVSSAQAVRVLDVIERSHELALAEVTLPQSTNGSVGFKACDNCVRQYMPVSGATTYYVGQQMVTLAQFGAAAARIRQAAGNDGMTLLMLHYDPDTDVATRIRVQGQ